MKKSKLFDTSILLFWFFNSEKLKKHLDYFASGSICVSYFSLWEITIKEQIGKIKLQIPLEKFSTEVVNTFEMLDFNQNDLMVYHKLPLVHRDPFDRMILAQSLSRSLTLVSSDKTLSAYQTQNLYLI